MPSFDRINEVIESLGREGTRYRTEKFAVVGIYAVLVLASLVWALTGIEITRELRGEIAVEKIERLDRHTFTLKNTGNTGWHDVRVVLNERYLAKIEELGAGAQRQLEPADFRYYYYVPRPWGAAAWERVGGGSKPGPHYPMGGDLESVEVRSREGRVEMSVGSDS